MVSFDDFITKWDGKGIDFDNYYGFQCMDLAHQYAVECIGKDIPAVAGAKDEWNLTIPGYDKVTNTPTGIPQKGDIMIWGTGVGAFGHIAVFISGDANAFTSFDQNWPINSLCHKQSHNYNGVLGWFHPQEQTNPQPLPTVINDQTKYDFGGEIGLQELGAIKSMISDLRRDNANLTDQRDQLTGQLALCVNDQHHVGPPITLAIFSTKELLSELIDRLKNLGR